MTFASSSTNTSDIFANLFQTMVHDLKASSSAWENVCLRATKLSIQLNSVANCLGNFVDTLQVVSDNANNIKGASRDIGAALTRFCMRQKSIEKCIRSLATALSDQFAPNLEKKSVEWRQRIHADFEKRHAKMFKKTAKRKTQADLIESRNCYSELVFEQRNQFIFFVNLLLPVMNMEINLLDEGAHVRQVRDSIETTINETDSNYIVKNLLEDLNGDGGNPPIMQSADSWHRRIISASKETVMSPEYQTVGSSSTSGSGIIIKSPTIRKMSESVNIDEMTQAGGTNNSLPDRPHTISASEMNASTKRAQISAHTFMPPNATVQYDINGTYGNKFSIPASLKPPLPKRQQQIINSDIYFPPKTTPSTINLNSINSMGGHSLSISANNLSSNNEQNIFQNPHSMGRPLSLIDDDINKVVNFEQQQQNYGNINEKEEILIINNNLQDPLKQNDRCSTSLIAETLQQIDQLGVELDSYCRTLKPTPTNIPIYSTTTDNASSGVGSSNASLEQIHHSHSSTTNYLNNGGRISGVAQMALAWPNSPSHSNNKCNMMGGTKPTNTAVRYRPDYIRPPPPLPQRRNSKITAATPTAPSVADCRGFGFNPNLAGVNQCSNSTQQKVLLSPTTINKHHRRTSSRLDTNVNGGIITSP